MSEWTKLSETSLYKTLARLLQFHPLILKNKIEESQNVLIYISLPPPFRKIIVSGSSTNEGNTSVKLDLNEKEENGTLIDTSSGSKPSPYSPSILPPRKPTN